MAYFVHHPHAVVAPALRTPPAEPADDKMTDSWSPQGVRDFLDAQQTKCAAGDNSCAAGDYSQYATLGHQEEWTAMRDSPAAVWQPWDGDLFKPVTDDFLACTETLGALGAESRDGAANPVNRSPINSFDTGVLVAVRQRLADLVMVSKNRRSESARLACGFGSAN
jgi:hypothetical protein